MRDGNVAHQGPLLNALRLIHDASTGSPAFQRGIAESVGRLHLEPEPEPEPAPSPEHQDDAANAIDLIDRLMDRFGVEDVMRWTRLCALRRGVRL